MDEFTAILRARELISKIDSISIPVSIKAYVDAIGAKLHIDHQLPAHEAGLCYLKNGKYHIRVNGNDSEERQRFTVCHEIAHIVLGLPSEHHELLWWSYAKRSPNEILCDVFAAELLLPFRLFKQLAEKSDISLTAIDDLAERCIASSMATGSRFAAVIDAPCAFVLSEGGHVRYASMSTALRAAKAWIPTKSALPASSMSHRTRSGAVLSAPEEIPADLWFSNWARGGVLLEHARHLARWDQTIALLWFEDEEVPEPEVEWRERQEEEDGLAELDGSLPWPGKRRRK